MPNNALLTDAKLPPNYWRKGKSIYERETKAHQ
jgi:hypothetical protein